MQQEDINTGRRWPQRQGSVTLLPHLHASIRLSAFHHASCSALARCAARGQLAMAAGCGHRRSPAFDMDEVNSHPWMCHQSTRSRPF